MKPENFKRKKRVTKLVAISRTTIVASASLLAVILVSASPVAGGGYGFTSGFEPQIIVFDNNTKASVTATIEAWIHCEHEPRKVGGRLSVYQGVGAEPTVHYYVDGQEIVPNEHILFDWKQSDENPAYWTVEEEFEIVIVRNYMGEFEKDQRMRWADGPRTLPLNDCKLSWITVATMSTEWSIGGLTITGLNATSGPPEDTKDSPGISTGAPILLLGALAWYRRWR